MPPRSRRHPKKKTSPQGQENIGTNIHRTRQDIEDDAEAYADREFTEIISNLGKELRENEKKRKRLQEQKDAERERIIAENLAAEEEERQKEELIEMMPSPKLRKKTKSLSHKKSKSMSKSKRLSRTRKHKSV